MKPWPTLLAAATVLLSIAVFTVACNPPRFPPVPPIIR